MSISSKEAGRRKRDKRRAAGLCLVCGQNPPAVGRSDVSCVSCLEAGAIRCANRGVRARSSANMRLAVYLRDSGECQMAVCLCPEGRKIDPLTDDKKWSPSLDHTVPRRDGGQDTFENLRAAHYSCNSSCNGAGGDDA